MVDFRKVDAANQSAADYGEPVDTNWGDLDGAIARAARTQFAETDPRRIDLPENSAADSVADAGDNIDAGGGWNPATAGGDTLGDFGETVVTGNRISKKGNDLDEYANYTYGLSLHFIPVETYNSLAKGGNYNPGSNVLIASAGRRDDSGFSRRSNFQEDFYFENLKFTTIIGYNSRNRGSNAIDVSFTIIEPYGITLMDRILKVATEEGAKNWNQMPFMLQIDFYGNTGDGEPVAIEGHTKYIPIKIIACNIKTSTRGSEYRFSAVPYNHSAFHETVGSSPAFLEVIAGTVGEFFKADQSAAGEADAITAEQKYYVDEKQASRNRNRLDPRDQPESTSEYRDLEQQERESKSTAYTVGSYAAALNSYQDQLKKNNHQSKPDRYEFVIDDEIAKSLIVKPTSNNVKSTPMATKHNKKATMIKGLRARLSGGSVPVTTDKQAIPINAGTSILDVINLAIRNSDYIAKNVNPTESNDIGNKPINFYKIIPEITIGEYDEKRKVYQQTFKYHIKKFSYYNTRYPGAIRGVPQTWEKEYSYMFTGKNNSILDFNIEFDALFYTAMTANASKFKTEEVDAAKAESDKGGGNESAQNNRLAVNRIAYVPNQTMVGTDKVGSNDVKNVGANDLYQSIMTNSRGDMINVKLKITGDPDLIKQDDYYSDLGKSIPMDAKEIFAYLTFRSPSDINQDTGLYDFESYPKSEFSGIYKIIAVENSFERGQFTQTLDLIRLMEQSVNGRADSTVDENRTTNEQADSRAQAENDATEESMRRMNFGQIIPGEGSAALYAEEGNVIANRRINTETGEVYTPVIDSVDGEDYFNKLKKLKSNVSSAPQKQITDGTVGGP